MERTLSTTISLTDLKVLIKDLIVEYMMEYSPKGSATKIDLYTYYQVFERFGIKPERLEEWKDKGLINEYPVGKTIKFKMSELFAAVESLVKEMKEQKAAEIPKEKEEAVL